MNNQTFKGADPTWANACVGDNGYPNYIEYSKGYSKASNLLLNYVLNSKGENIDHLIYPICFNMRHSIELRLKGAIEEITKLSKIKKTPLPTFDLIGSHNIGNIWTYFKKNANLLDIRFTKLNKVLNNTISDFANIDPTGQTFRYPNSNAKQQHLTEQKVINCVALKSKFAELEHNLDDLIRLTESLIDEYKLGTFTTKLSRVQIFQFVRELPHYDQWSQDFFTEIKNKLKVDYNLSNNDFNKVVIQIKSNYELSHKIGIQKKLAFLSDNDILEICHIWITYFEPKYRELYKQDHLTSKENSLDTIDEWFKSAKLHNKGMTLLEYKLSAAYIADLQSLFYLSIDHHQYSENYQYRFESFHDEAKFNDLSDSLDHLLSKGIFLEELLKSLFFLNQTDLAEKIIKIYDLEKVFQFIPKARARQFFQHFELMGY